MVVVVGSQCVAVGMTVSRTVTAAGFQPVLERDPDAVFDTTCQSQADGLILDAGMGTELWPSIVGLVRNSPAYRFAIVVGTGGAREAVQAFDAGADDYVRLPFDGAEFGSRLKTAERKLRFVRTSPLHVIDGPTLVAGLTAWTNLGEILRSALAALLCVECQHVEDYQPSGPVYTIRIKFALTLPRASVVLLLQADARALSSVTELLLGTPTDDALVLEDAAKEILNTLGGAFKREALPLVEFTTGIPELVTDQALRAQADDVPAKRCIVGWGDGHAVLVHAVLRPDETHTLIAAKLVEGMVLADDLRNPLGVLVAPRGTRLTTSAISRLNGVLGRRVVVRVASSS